MCAKFHDHVVAGLERVVIAKMTQRKDCARESD